MSGYTSYEQTSYTSYGGGGGGGGGGFIPGDASQTSPSGGRKVRVCTFHTLMWLLR